MDLNLLIQVRKDIKMVETINGVCHKIWKTCHYSPKSKYELQVICSELNTIFHHSSSVKGTCWVPRIHRALTTFLKGSSTSGDIVSDHVRYSTVVVHMESLPESRRNVDLVARGRSVALAMNRIEFAIFCHFLADVFGEMAKLSLQLQKSNLIYHLRSAQ